MSSSVNERVGALRARERVVRSVAVAELTRDLLRAARGRAGVQELQELLARTFGPTQLDKLQWALLDAVALRGGVTGKARRRRLDAYFTKPPVAAAVTRRVLQLVPRARSILEPSAGLGAFVRAAAAAWPGASITAVDIRIRKALRALGPAVGRVHLDFLRYTVRGYDLIIGNPPFSVAEAHVRHALDLLAPRGHLGFILRAGFAGSLERVPLWAQPGLRHVAHIVPRPSFLETGSDQTEYALYLWQRGYEGIAEHGKPIVWRGATPASSPTAELLERGAA